MDRTTAPFSVDGAYVDDDPTNEVQGTLLIAADRNAIQEEILGVIEGAGLTPSAGDNGQMFKALKKGAGSLIDADKLDGQEGSYYSGLVTTHGNLTNAHSATADATKDRIILRDGNARAKVANPAENGDIVNKGWFESQTIPVTRGGTNKTSLTTNAVIAGNNTAIKEIASANGALYATAANAEPKFGTLPVAQGGTGETSVTARYALLGPSSAGAPTWRAVVSADISDATDAATASVIIKRDDSGRAKVADPSADADIATRGWIKKTSDNVAQPSMTGTATFTKSSNKIAMTGIKANLGLEIGDVIQVSGSAKAGNNKIFTCESVNTDDVVVNYEHRNGAGVLSLTDESGKTGVTIKRVAKWYNAPLGLGQAWVDVNSLVVVNSSRTNSTNRPIGLSIVHNNNGGTQTNITIDELLRANNQSSVVMSQDYYVFNASWKTSKALNYCWEMR